MHFSLKLFKKWNEKARHSCLTYLPVLAPVTMAVFPFSCTGQARGSQRPLLCRRTTSASTAVDTNHSGWNNKSVQCIVSAAATVAEPSREEGKAACSLRACVVAPASDCARESSPVKDSRSEILMLIWLTSSRGRLKVWNCRGWSCSRCCLCKHLF